MKISTKLAEKIPMNRMLLCRKVWRILFNEQARVQYYCQFIGGEKKEKLRPFKKLVRRKLRKTYHIVIGLNTIIGKGLILPHPQNIVLGEGAIIGSNVTIYQDVTIGVKDVNSIHGQNLRDSYPHIHDNVCIYAGAKVIGGIEIGENSIIGCNAVVMKKVKDCGVYGGVPAKLLKMRSPFPNRGGGVLLLNNSADMYFFTYLFLENVQIRKPFSEYKRNLILLAFSKLMKRTGLFYGYYFGDWFENLMHFDKLIVFDNAYNKYLDKMLDHFQGKKILFFWNPADNLFSRNDRNHIVELFDHVYSFDENDCKKYKLEFRNSVYTRQVHLEEKAIKYDVCFMGADKGRLNELRCLYEKITENKLKCRFYIYSDQRGERKEGWEVSNKWMAYKDYLEWVSQSKCILDVNQNGQRGFSLRILESVFFGKKIITNNESILHSDLYHTNNVFLIDFNKFNTLADFMGKEVKVFPKEILDQYDCENWIRNLFTSG